MKIEINFVAIGRVIASEFSKPMAALDAWWDGPPPSRRSLPPLTTPPKGQTSDPSSGPQPDAPKAKENTMSFKDDAEAAAGRLEKIGENVAAAIEAAAAKAKAAAETVAADAMKAATDDWNAAKAIYENTIADLEAKVAAFNAPAQQQ